jgi:hypothetical protein
MKIAASERTLWRSSRLWIAVSYLMAFLAVTLGVLGGAGLATVVVVANVCLALTFIVGLVGLVHLWWKPRHRVSLPLKLIGTLLGLIPASFLLFILLAIAFRQ